MLFEEYQDASLVLISEWNDFIYSESPGRMTHSNKFLLKRIYGSKNVFEKCQEDFLVHEHLLYLSGM